MSIEMPWKEFLLEKTCSLSHYVTGKQFDKVIKELLNHPRSLLSGLQYIIPANPPFIEHKHGLESSGQADVHTISLNDNRQTKCQIQHWRKATAEPLQNEIIDLLKELFERYWKKELRTESAGMIDIKRSAEAIDLAKKTLAFYFTENQICSILFCDLDDFGQVNKKYSQEKGDEVIKEFGAIIEGAFYEKAICLHNGGDEFVILYPCEEGGSALNLAYNLSQLIAENKFNLEDIDLGVSIGISQTLPGTQISFEELCRKANTALTECAKKPQKGKTRFGKRDCVVLKKEDTSRQFKLTECIVKSDILSLSPFANEWLNCISQIVFNSLENSNSLDLINDKVNSFVRWMSIDQDNSQKFKSNSSFEEGFDGDPNLSSTAIAFAVIHGLLKAKVILNYNYNQTLGLQYSNDTNDAVLYLQENSKIIWESSQNLKLKEEYDVGSFWNAECAIDLLPEKTSRSILIQIGHKNIGIPASFFANKIIIDDRPTQGGGLPDFWELAVAKLITQILIDPNIVAVYIFGNHNNAKETVKKLRDINNWDAKEIAYKTALSEHNIQEAALKLDNKIIFVKDKNELISHLADKLRPSHKIQPYSKVFDSQASRFLRRELKIDDMALSKKDGCRVNTLAEAYPLVLEIARKSEDEAIIVDQAGQYLRELVDFKIHLNTPTQDMMPLFYQKDEKSLEKYYSRVFDQQGLFGTIFDQTKQLDAVLNHIASIIKVEGTQFATRRAVLVIPHKIQNGGDISPLGLISIRVIPRFARHRIYLNYSFTWRTVEALVGLPYSLYGSIKFGQYLTQKIKDRLALEVQRKTSMGWVSYMAHSLHLFADDYGKNIVRKIVDDASI